ncbi:hypothetical protein [Marinobacterium sp. BA1]|uniref:hypothetical protein n=1 Tax=Marinobacterium sp. BA1 TaxID=3138931 RepID=UPI0032E59A92
MVSASDRLHRPFRLIMQLRSPVVLTDFAPSLDGVLYSVLEAHLPNADYTERLAHLDTLLTLHNEGVYHASSMRFGVSAAYENGRDLSRTVSVAKYVRSDSMARHKLKSEFYAPFGKRAASPYPAVQTAGGPYKNRLTERDAFAAPFVVFEGHGEGPRIHDLLSHYLMGIGYDADNANAGAIGDIELVPLDSDISLVLPDGQANRCLPVAMAQALDATGLNTHNRLCPPYYQGEKVPVIAPERVRIITNTEAMSA